MPTFSLTEIGPKADLHLGKSTMKISFYNPVFPFGIGIMYRLILSIGHHLSKENRLNFFYMRPISFKEKEFRNWVNESLPCHLHLHSKDNLRRTKTTSKKSFHSFLLLEKLEGLTFSKKCPSETISRLLICVLTFGPRWIINPNGTRFIYRPVDDYPSTARNVVRSAHFGQILNPSTILRE